MTLPKLALVSTPHLWPHPQPSMCTSHMAHRTSCATDMPPALFGTCTALFSLGPPSRTISVSPPPSSAACPPLTCLPDSDSAPWSQVCLTEPSIFYASYSCIFFPSFCWDSGGQCKDSSVWDFNIQQHAWYPVNMYLVNALMSKYHSNSVWLKQGQAASDWLCVN